MAVARLSLRGLDADAEGEESDHADAEELLASALASRALLFAAVAGAIRSCVTQVLVECDSLSSTVVVRCAAQEAAAACQGRAVRAVDKSARHRSDWQTRLWQPAGHSLSHRDLSATFSCKLSTMVCLQLPINAPTPIERLKQVKKQTGALQPQQSRLALFTAELVSSPEMVVAHVLMCLFGEFAMNSACLLIIPGSCRFDADGDCRAAVERLRLQNIRCALQFRKQQLD